MDTFDRKINMFLDLANPYAMFPEYFEDTFWHEIGDQGSRRLPTKELL
jgi:hypothetical protein